MDLKLLTIAALGIATAVTASAASHPSGIGIPNAKSPSIIGAPPMTTDLKRCHGDRQNSRSGRFSCGGSGEGWAYDDGEWAYSNNRSWDSNSYNDWWNDRPDRAFPRWVQEQHGGPCDPSRMWWSGTGWHC